MTTTEDFKSYKDRFGLVNLGGDTTQNGVLFTTEYAVQLIKSNAPVEDELYALLEAVRNCQIQPGLLKRHPETDEYDSMDNTTAALVLSDYLDNGKLAKDIRDHGLYQDIDGYDTTQDTERNKRFYWLAKALGFGTIRNVWNNSNPNKFCFFSWFGRSPGLMGLIDIAAIGSTTPFRSFSLVVGQLIPTFQDTEDGWKLSYLVWQVVKDYGFFYRLAYKYWVKRLYKCRPGGMRQVYETYYGPNHPLTKHMVDLS